MAIFFYRCSHEKCYLLRPHKKYRPVWNLTKKDVVSLYEYEIESIAGTKIFQVSELSFGDSVPENVQPLGTPAYDLRTVPWNHPHLFKWLKRRGHQTLKNIACAIESLGIRLTLDSRKSALSIADAVYAAAKYFNWTALTVSAVKSLPSTVDRTTPETPQTVEPETEPEPEMQEEEENEENGEAEKSSAMFGGQDAQTRHRSR